MILLAGALLALWPSTASAAFPGKNGPIAFTALHSTAEQCPGGGSPSYDTAADEGIFTMNPDGSDATQVSSQHRPLMCDYPIEYYFDDDPSYSPSGKRFAFTLAHHAYANNADDLNLYPYVAVMGVDGSNRQVLSELDNSDPAFSPNGKKIVFDDRAKIAVMSSKGRHERILTTREGIRAEYGFEPSFFPSGARIVYVSGEVRRPWRSSISTIRLDRSHRRRLTTGNRSANFNSPDVSPNGRRIVFGRGTGIYVMRSDGTHKHRLADGSDPVFSPNGKRIAFSRTSGEQSEVIVMRSNGSDQHAVIPNPLPFGVSDPSELGLSQPSWGPQP